MALAEEKPIKTFQQEAAVFNKDLQVGWNLISIPVDTADDSIISVLSSIAGIYKTVMIYDGEWKTYSPDRTLNSLQKINETIGVWIEMNQSDTLTISGNVVTSKIFNLKQGWNLIGYPSLNNNSLDYIFGLVNDSIIDIFTFEDGVWKNVSTVKSGNGYWINFKEDVQWLFDGRFREYVVYPDKIAALGDSITQAANANGVAETMPQHSWTTGYDSGDIVNSHYERILAINSNMLNNNFNDAVNGARMDDIFGQAQIAISQSPEYITILMGGNDACRPSLAEMTDPAVYENYFRQAMENLTAELPDTKIIVVALPDIYQLYDVGIAKGCSWLWPIAGICRALTGSNAADRLIFRQRVIEYNQILQNVTLEYGQLYAPSIFDLQFTTSDIAWDCFHPSIDGQMKIAEVSWNDGYYSE